MILEVDVSPPADLMSLRLTLAYMTFDPCDLTIQILKFQPPSYNELFIKSELWSSDDRPSDGKGMHISPPCRLHRWAQKWCSEIMQNNVNNECYLMSILTLILWYSSRCHYPLPF